MLVLGHRGAAAVATENTLAGVRAARVAGADGVEVDVRRTADGALVCSHDTSLARLGGPAAPVIELTAAQVAAAPLAGGEPAATVEQVLDELAGGLAVLEVKNVPGEPDFDAPAEATAHALVSLLAERAARGQEDRVVVSSFDWFAIDVARDAGLRTGFLTPPGVRALACIDRCREHGYAEAHPHWTAVLEDPTAVSVAAGAGIAVACWTVDDAEILTALAELGVAAVITNDPARLVRR